MTHQTLIESGDALENAAVMLDMCRTEFERAGQRTAAQSLRGLDITTMASAHAALLWLYALPIVKGLEDIRSCTIEAVRSVIYSPRSALRMAS